MAAPNPGTHTAVKIIGAIAWLAGLLFLFLYPPLGILLLLVAIVLSILSLTWTRQARHAEVVAAATGTTRPVEKSAVQSRYDELQRANPGWSHNQLWDQAERDVAEGWTPSNHAAPLTKSPADRLAELDALRRDGTITDAEYEAQRAQILRDV